MSATWRDGIALAAAYTRMLMHNARESARVFKREDAPETMAVTGALGNLAERLAYIASMPSHEGLKALHELGDDRSRAWVIRYMELGYDPGEIDAPIGGTT